jgi:hypothetical protein
LLAEARTLLRLQHENQPLEAATYNLHIFHRV